MKKVKISKEYLKKRWGEDGRTIRINANYYIINKGKRTILSEEQSILFGVLSYGYILLWLPIILIFLAIMGLNTMMEWILNNTKIAPKWCTYRKVIRFDDLTLEQGEEIKRNGGIK